MAEVKLVQARYMLSTSVPGESPSSHRDLTNIVPVLRAEVLRRAPRPPGALAQDCSMPQPKQAAWTHYGQEVSRVRFALEWEQQQSRVFRTLLQRVALIGRVSELLGACSLFFLTHELLLLIP